MQPNTVSIIQDNRAQIWNKIRVSLLSSVIDEKKQDLAI